MVNTNRYNGLLFLKAIGLPVPSFQKISKIEDLEEHLAFEDTPFGWTVRTCKKNGVREFNLFFKNNLNFKELKYILTERFRKFNDEFYIIYHSWDFDYSLNIIKDKSQYIVEGKLGSQKEISLGTSLPKFTIIINSHNLIIQQSLLANPSVKIKNGVYSVLRLLQKNVIKERYYTEVALTKQKQIYFYEFTDISRFNEFS